MTHTARILTEAADAAQNTVRCQTHAEANGKQNTIDFLRQLAADIPATRNPSVVTDRVLSEVLAERIRQDDQWGEQNHPDGTGGLHYAAMADEARSMCEHVAKGREGGPRWALILLEEAYEALTEADPARLRAELIQVAAVAVAWVEAIDGRRRCCRDRRDTGMNRLLALAAYVATIPAANWAVTEFGAVPAGFGYAAPAGVYFVGLALVLRDLAREAAGRAAVLVAIAVGALLSWWLADPALALASAAAFAVSEAMDFAVYEPLRKRGLLVAMLASNAVGLLADSLIFLWLAFDSFAYLPGQLLGKTWMTLAAVAVIAVIARRRAQAVTV